MYRTAPSLSLALAARLGPLGFAEVVPDDERKEQGVLRLYRRKTWNTNRAVVVAAPPPAWELGPYAELMRGSAGPFLGSSWWNQLGLQLVFEVPGEPPPTTLLEPLVDRINTQGILIQSVFVYDRTTFAHTSARTWGQFITGPFQDAIAASLDELASG